MNMNKPDSILATKINSGDFIITAELLPHAAADTRAVEEAAAALKGGPCAVNVADNHYGVAMSSLAASAILLGCGIEPVYQLVTRDRNRIALQSDLLGAAALGIKNVLCLTGYHQALVGCPDSANVFDIDSIQLAAAVANMNETGLLIGGGRIEGAFCMLAGAAANPALKPLELNVMRIKKKAAAGARFIQTQAVFDVAEFKLWLEAARGHGITERVAILAGVLPLASAEEAVKLNEIFTDFNIPQEVIGRLKSAGGIKEQKQEGIAICAAIIKELRGLPGLRGVHIFSGGNEGAVLPLMQAAGLK
jgi:methylenetetrahydrofolate reductase (NADPH)